METFKARQIHKYLSWFVLCVTIVFTTRASTAQDIAGMSRIVTDLSNNANGYNLTVIILALLNGTGYLERRGMFTAAGKAQTKFTDTLGKFDALLEKLGRNQRMQTSAVKAGFGTLRREVRLTRRIVSARYETVAERLAETERSTTEALGSFAAVMGQKVGEGLEAAARIHAEAASANEALVVEKTIQTLVALGFIVSRPSSPAATMQETPPVGVAKNLTER